MRLIGCLSNSIEDFEKYLKLEKEEPIGSNGSLQSCKQAIHTPNNVIVEHQLALQFAVPFRF